MVSSCTPKIQQLVCKRELSPCVILSNAHALDRRPALQSILRSMLVTYSHLLKALPLPPPNPQSEEEPEWRKYVEWLTIMSQNIMSAANDLRPVQARYNLEAMMVRQLRLRRNETAAIHQFVRNM